MTITKKVTWTTQTGLAIEVNIEVVKKVVAKTGYADGWNVPLGEETYESTEITITADGKYLDSSSYAPHKNTDVEQIAKGGYAYIHEVYITEERYEQIMAAITEAETEATEEDYTALKNAEIAKEAEKEAAIQAKEAEYAKLVKNGLCPKCGTFCCGDCEA